MHQQAYGKLAIQSFAGGLIMYLVMFTMIDRFGDFYHNLNTLYMTVMMIAPMVALMLLIMPAMFTNRILNMAILAVAAVAFVVALTAMRTQGGIGDRQFLRSMIPHHSGAILMCEKSAIRDARIIELCAKILRSQKEEIAQMKAILNQPAPPQP